MIAEQRKITRTHYMNDYMENMEQQSEYYHHHQNQQTNQYNDYNQKQQQQQQQENDIYQSTQKQQQQIQVQILPQQDWGENTTAITGDFSDFNDDMTEDGRSSHFNGKTGAFYSRDNKNNVFVDMHDSNLIQIQNDGFFKSFFAHLKKYFGFICTFCVSLCSFITPILFILLPRLNLNQQWQVSECGLECEGILIGIAFKLFILLFGSWAIFAKKPRVSLPRIYELRILILFLLCIMTFSFWLFYAVRIIDNKSPDYHTILQFTVSYVDVLLFIYIIAVFILEIRHLKTEYVIKIIRSPDGEQFQYPIGKMSIQRAAVCLLENYYKDFKVYNPWLENAHRKRGIQLSQLEQAAVSDNNKKRVRNANISSSSAVNFGKSYNNNNNNQDIFDDNQSIKTTETNMITKKKSSSRMNADSRSIVGGNFSANDRFYEEYEYERRLRKRRARLLTSTEEAFTHIRRVQNDNGSITNVSNNSTTLMDPIEAAQAIFTSIARDLRRYLRITRQQPYFTREDIIAHLAQCISYDMSPKSFLQRYLNGENLIFNDRAQLNYFFNHPSEFNGSNLKRFDQNWILICDSALYENIENNLMFVLKQNEVTLMCTCKRVPRFNLIEDILDPKRNKFILKLNSETTV